MQTIKISNTEVLELLEAPPLQFPKYFNPLLNLANYYAQGTRARTVGQMSELIQEFEGTQLKE